MSIKATIETKLASLLEPHYIEVVNESHMHSVPANSETHFKLVVVSAHFNGLRNVARHQKVYAFLQDELAGPVHALALHTYTEEEWAKRNGDVPQSPDCKGGS